MSFPHALRSFPWHRWLCASVAIASFAGVSQAQLDNEPRPWVMYLAHDHGGTTIATYYRDDPALLDEFKRTKRPIYAGAVEFHPDRIIFRPVGAVTDAHLRWMLRRNAFDSTREIRMPHHPIPARRTRDGPAEAFLTIPYDSPDAPMVLRLGLRVYNVVRLTCGKPFDPDWRPVEADFKNRRYWFEEPCER